MRQACVILLAAAAVAAPVSAGQHPVPPGGQWANQHLGTWRPDQPDYGFEFATITHASNRPANASERSSLSIQYWPNLGQVNHEYRISTTEVTASQWMPFFNAILPQWEAAGGSSFDLPALDHMSLDSGSPTGWRINPGEERSAVRVNWQLAARYCNWLHNGAPDAANATAETFTTGAYTLPWGDGAPPMHEDQLPLAHNPGARYRLPTMDEWIKAAHYDPDKHGEGQEGYWTHHGSQDEPLTPGLPWEGGETNAGPSSAFGGADVDREAIPVAAYDVTSPWGLYDTSGQESEWTETPGALVFFDGTLVPSHRYTLGESLLNFGAFADSLDDVLLLSFVGTDVAAARGFRIVALVPAPGTAALLALPAILVGRRRRAALAAAGAVVIAGSLSAGVNPIPLGGQWANQHLGTWRPDQPDYGFEFAIITHAGNRPANASERSTLSMQYWPNLGQVNHEYRISTTEVTASQWEPFFLAIRPQWEAAGGVVLLRHGRKSSCHG